MLIDQVRIRKVVLDLIGASRSLEAHDAMRTDNPLALTMLSRLLRLRGRCGEVRELLHSG